MRDLVFDAEGTAKRTPETAAQENMRPVLPKRFYKEVTTGEEGGRWRIYLDGRGVKTPAKADLAFPTQQAAELAAGEWQAQEKEINPAKMPVTRLANTAIDGISTDTQAVLEDIVRFAANDLVCYRASHPASLVDAQCQHWDPVLDKILTLTGAGFETGEGIMHVEQDKQAVDGFSRRLANHDEPLRLACLHTITTLTGSAMIALLAAEGAMELEEAWDAAHVDENHNISLWGEDHEAARHRQNRFAEMKAAHELLGAL